MTANIDTLLIALYVFCDDHVVGRRRIGRPPLLSDAGLLCLAIDQVLLGFPGERHWIRYARKNLRHLFLRTCWRCGRSRGFPGDKGTGGHRSGSARGADDDGTPSFMS